jgi:hypothetical protein
VIAANTIVGLLSFMLVYFKFSFKKWRDLHSVLSV